MATRPIDLLPALLEISRRQHGVVLLKQLFEIGLSRATVDRLVRDGWLRRIRPGAYALASAAPSRWEPAVAAALIGGEGVALSHSTAAAIHNLPGLVYDGTIELTAVRPNHPRARDATVHRISTPFADDRVLVDGVPVTTPARTVVDLSTRLSEALLAHVVDEGCIQRLWNIGTLVSILDRQTGRGKAQNDAFRRLLGHRLSLPTGATWLEERAIQIFEPLAPFEVQHQVVLDDRVYVLDVAWPLARVAAEVDGWGVRSQSRSKFDADRRKANALAAHGWKVAHITSVMDDDEILRSVSRLLPAWRK